MESLWMEDYRANRVSKTLNGNIETDTAVIGGGLCGLLCAHMLKQRGVGCVVAEARKIGSGTTCNTTAKITAQHGLIYSQIEDKYGFSAAKGYLDANLEAVGEYRRLASYIPCDFEEKTAYVYSRDKGEKLKREAKLYERMKLEPAFLKNPPIPVNTAGALGMPRQAQFHPLKFLNGIAKDLDIYEDTFVTDVLPGKVLAENGSIRAKRIILATHYPMVNLRGLYFMKLYQHRSYVLALEQAPDPGGMYIDEQEGGLSFRTHKGCLLLGGGSHQTGKKGGGWDELRSIVKAAYPGAKERCFWATQDCMTLDSMPYIGRHSRDGRELFAATGFNKWGITGSMAAAKLISELITQGDSRYAKLFSPSRTMLHPQLFINMGQAMLGLLSFGKRCPHMGCALKWNPAERSWDCPCHGSRFDENGRLIDNPSKRDIDIG